MSQFPSPYTPPSVSISYEPAPHTLLAGPRRTGMLMLVLGSLVVLMGACNAITALLIPASELLQRQRAFLVNAPPMLPPEQMRHWTMAVGGATVAVGILLVILGAAVRRGNRGAIGAALGITSLLVLICGIATLVFLLGGLAEPAMLPLACFPAAPLLLMGWQLAWLISASRSSAALIDARRQTAAQQWQYQQNMMALGGAAGGGYADPAAAPPGQPSDSERGK